MKTLEQIRSSKALKAILALEDGTIVRGVGFGAADKTVAGEFVFNTGMTGYQESLTDPSYNGQILMMTYPLIGNYGINEHNFESDKIQVEGYAVREFCEIPSHRDCTLTISEFLANHDIPGIANIDTRALTIKTREYGTLKAILKTYYDDGNNGIDAEELVAQARAMTHPCEHNLVQEVSCVEIKHLKGTGKINVVLIDCGVKANIIRSLLKRCNVIQVPYNISADKLYELKPDGIFISNGPGDPSHPELVASTVTTLREIIQDFPVMGICLGHQLLSLTFGAKTFKLKFGHRGANQPVKDLNTGRVYITAQNHGYAVEQNNGNKISDSTGEIEFTQINVNDSTVEGMEHRELPIFSIQYHPEASPGPWDTNSLFDKFIEMIKSSKGFKRGASRTKRTKSSGSARGGGRPNA